jgi:CDP-glucose 4,6-dehydratase
VNLSRIIPGTIVAVLKNESPIIRSDGTPLREFVHVEDVASAYLALAENIETVKGEAFNIGTNEPVQILELTNQIIRLAGRDGKLEPTIMLKRKIEHEIDAQFLSTQKICDRIGWKAQITRENGLLQTIEWYNRNLNRLA